MFKRIIALAGVIILSAGTGFAQHHIETGVFGGWSFSDGVSGNTVIAGDGGSYNRIDPKDSGLFGFSVSGLIGEQAEIGFMYSRQSSSLLLGGTLGTPDRDLGSMALSNYHGTFEYNFGEEGSHVRPFIYMGLGATNFGSVDFRTPALNGTIQGHSKFSTQWGTGVKYFMKPNIAIRGAVSWIPSYIKSDATGYWCDPYWGCYTTGNAQYSNQFHLTGGVSFRF